MSKEYSKTIMRNIFNTLFYHTIDFLFPSYCINCGKGVSNSDLYLCDTCKQNIEYLREKCEICSGELLGGSCCICSNRKFYIDKNITIAAYSGVMKELLHNYKFNKRRKIYKYLSELAFREILPYRDSIDIITSVPINLKKRRERGFNQSELIGKDIARKLKKDYRSLLKEKYHFKTQRRLGYRDRFFNILDRYSIVSPENIGRKNLLIVDDVFTTGATINECARVLKANGVNRVYSLTMARANIKRVDNFLFSV